MNCNTTHYRANSSSVPGDPTHRTGYVDDGDLPALLRRAEVVAYPARQEGFGLPALEALACGTPLITTAGSVMADMAGTAAVLVTPGSVDDLAGAIGAVLDGGAGAERRRAGLDVAARHTWDAAAAGHVAAYRWAMTAPSPPGGRARGR